MVCLLKKGHFTVKNGARNVAPLINFDASAIAVFQCFPLEERENKAQKVDSGFVDKTKPGH